MKVFVLEIGFKSNGADEKIYPVLLQNDRELILVDGGYPGFLPLLERAAEQQGLSLSDLTGIIITHHDIDHMGVASEIKSAYPHVKSYAPENEAPYVSGKKRSLRLQQAEELYACLPEEAKAKARAFCQLLETLPPVPVDIVVSGEQVLFSGEVEILSTPGHMPGHISLWLPAEKILVASDALVVEEGKFGIANPQFTLDLPQALRSIEKMKAKAPLKIICYHGGVVEEDIDNKLQEVLHQYAQGVV